MKKGSIFDDKSHLITSTSTAPFEIANFLILDNFFVDLPINNNLFPLENTFVTDWPIPEVDPVINIFIFVKPYRVF